MSTLDRIAGVLAGIVLMLIAVNILIAENPSVGFKSGPGFPTFYWVGWITLPASFFLIVTNIRGFFSDRKKRLANIARYRAEREAAEASREDKPHS